MFFVIEIRRERSATVFDGWDFWERYEHLGAARSRLRVMFANRPELKGHFRIIRCEYREDYCNGL